jgi:hypothetical protein
VHPGSGGSYVSRQRVTVPVPALALRRAEAAASVGVSVEVFDRHIRPHLPAVRIGGVTVYIVAALQSWLSHSAATVHEDMIGPRGRG